MAKMAPLTEALDSFYGKFTKDVPEDVLKQFERAIRADFKIRNKRLTKKFDASGIRMLQEDSAGVAINTAEEAPVLLHLGRSLFQVDEPEYIRWLENNKAIAVRYWDSDTLDYIEESSGTRTEGEGREFTITRKGKRNKKGQFEKDKVLIFRFRERTYTNYYWRIIENGAKISGLSRQKMFMVLVPTDQGIVAVMSKRAIFGGQIIMPRVFRRRNHIEKEVVQANDFIRTFQPNMRNALAKLKAVHVSEVVM